MPCLIFKNKRSPIKRVCELLFEGKTEEEVHALLKQLGIGTIGLLTISNCNLQAIPTDLQRQSGLLKGLSLKNNRIENLLFFGSWEKHLKYLDISNNNLKALPESINKLVELQELNLDHNNFISVPDILIALPKLQRFHMTGNPLEEQPAYIKPFKKWGFLGGGLTWQRIEGSSANSLQSAGQLTQTISALPTAKTGSATVDNHQEGFLKAGGDAGLKLVVRTA